VTKKIIFFSRWDFISWVVAGNVTNILYEDHHLGEEYQTARIMCGPGVGHENSQAQVGLRPGVERRTRLPLSAANRRAEASGEARVSA